MNQPMHAPRKRWPLWLQLVPSLLAALLVVNLLTAPLARIVLSDFEFKQVAEQSHDSFALLAATAIDAVITEDIPLLETIAAQSLEQARDMIELSITNEDDELLVQSVRADHAADENVRTYRYPIELEGERFGTININWDIEPVQREIDRHVTEVQVFISAMLVLLTSLTAILIHWLAIRPLRRIAGHLDSLSVNTRTSPLRTPRFASRELELLTASTNQLTSLIHQKEQRERELKELVTVSNRNRLKNEAVLSASLDAMITIDHEGKVLDFNGAAVRTFGWSRDEIIGQSMAAFIVPPEMREAHERGMERYLATGEGPVLGKRLELTAQHKNGHQFPIEIAITPIELDQGPVFTAFIRDISERIAAETELRLAAQAFESSEAMLITDANGSIIRVNSAFTRITGYEAAAVLGKNPSILLSSKHNVHSLVYRRMWRQLLESGTWSGEVYNMRENGEVYPEHLNISVVKNAEGETTHYVAHFVDITEQKQNEKRLRQAQREAETANEAKSQFLATMSHEIRTPMNGVLGILGLLRGTVLNDQQQKLVQTGRESGELLLNIINDILDYSKMEADKLQLEHTGFDLHRLLRQTVEFLRPQAESKELTLALTSEPGLPQFARGDPCRLRQVLINLINNAIKFTPSGGINIRVSSVPRDADGGSFRLHCKVEDTGIGIPNEFHESLFDEFTMADQSHSRAYGGSGLGLAICKRLVSRMGGSIDFHSEAGKGSTFFFAVELESADAVDHESESDTPRLRPAAGTRVLLAEDNPANQVVIRSILEHADLRVDMVANGREAVDAVRTLPYDIVLMDISMPEMDGIAATHDVRQLPGGAGSIPIVALTAHALPGDKERFLAAGMNDYLTKPINRAAALHCIARWTGARATAEPEDGAIQSAPVKLLAESGEAYVDEPALQSQQVLDINALEQLARDTSPQTLPRMLEIFREETSSRVQTITEKLSPIAVEQLQSDAHTLKSSAGTFGAFELQQLALDVELACRNGLPRDAAEKARRIPEAWNQVSMELDRFLANSAIARSKAR
jgi:PAS domain S-box-containing protein